MIFSYATAAFEMVVVTGPLAALLCQQYNGSFHANLENVVHGASDSYNIPND
jgi:hypothetical protein